MKELYGELTRVLTSELAALPDKPDETPETTLRCLWAKAAGAPLAFSQVGSFDPPELTPDQIRDLRDLVSRRLEGVPLAHLTGRQDFMDVVLLATRAALVPRKETEILGWAALDKIRAGDTATPLVIDLCTGCGNVALGCAVHAPSARVLGSDLSEQAVELAKRNAEFVGRPDVTFLAGDLSEPFLTDEFLGKVDVLTCNPPYISSAQVDEMHEEIRGHEPRLAFDGGPFGIRILQRLLKDAPRLLTSGGWFLFEVGLGQGPPMQKKLERIEEFTEVESFTDHAGEVRALAARRR